MRAVRARGTQGVGRGMRSLRGLARRRPTGLEWRVRGKDELACVGLKLLSRSTHANARTRSERGRGRRVERLVFARSLFGRARFVSFIPFRSKDTAGARAGSRVTRDTRAHGSHRRTSQPPLPTTHQLHDRATTVRWNVRGPRADSTVNNQPSAAAPEPTQKRPLPRCKYVHRKSLIAHSRPWLIQG